MRKKTQDELGTLVTREMKVMLQDESLTKDQRFDILAAVMFDTPTKNQLLMSFAKSLKAGFEQINGSRYKSIERIREFKRRSERNRRHTANMEDDKLPSNSIPIHGSPCPSIPIHGELKAKARINISPYNPPKGGRKLSSKVSSERKPGKKPKKGGARPAEPSPQSPDEPTATGMANAMVEKLEQTEAFARMRVNRRNLTRHLLQLAKKNSGRLEEWALEVLDGLEAWTAAWKADDWQYAPGKITKWLADEKYLQPPRKKKDAPTAEGSGCGECGAEIV